MTGVPTICLVSSLSDTERERAREREWERVSTHHDLHSSPPGGAPVHGHALVDHIGHGSHNLCRDTWSTHEVHQSASSMAFYFLDRFTCFLFVCPVGEWKMPFKKYNKNWNQSKCQLIVFPFVNLLNIGMSNVQICGRLWTLPRFATREQQSYPLKQSHYTSCLLIKKLPFDLIYQGQECTPGEVTL